MNARLLFAGIALTTFLASAGTAYSCPDIAGFPDRNCDQRLTIVAFGDSITYGKRDTTKLGYPGRLKRLIKDSRTKMYNLGIPGESTDIGLRRAGKVLPGYKTADYTLLLEGVNDFWVPGHSALVTRNNLYSILAIARRAGSMALLGNLTFVRRGLEQPWVDSVNSVIRPQTIFNFYSLGRWIIGWDQLHPSNDGYQQMAALAFSTLKKYSRAHRPADSDHDGVYDFAEKNIYHTDPRKADTDGDGLTDGEEIFTYHTDPLKTDTDGDGISDYVEVKVIFTNPLNPAPSAPAITRIEALPPAD